MDPPARSSVYPSGGDFITKVCPMLPPAPGRFSTKNCWPRIALNFSATMRAGRSSTVPAPVATTIFTGLDGYGWAWTDSENAASKTNRRTLMVILPAQSLEHRITALEVRHGRKEAVSEDHHRVGRGRPRRPRVRRQGSLRPGGEVLAEDHRRAVPAHRGRAPAPRARVSAASCRPLPGAPRPARRRLVSQGPLRQRAHGPRDRRGGHARRGGRPAALERSAVPGIGPGRELRRAWAEVEGRRREGRGFDARRAGQLERWPHRPAPRHASTRSALQRHRTT